MFSSKKLLNYIINLSMIFFVLLVPNKVKAGKRVNFNNNLTSTKKTSSSFSKPKLDTVFPKSEPQNSLVESTALNYKHNLENLIQRLQYIYQSYQNAKNEKQKNFFLFEYINTLETLHELKLNYNLALASLNAKSVIARQVKRSEKLADTLVEELAREMQKI